jgi:NADPH2:quinone reductase
VLGTAITGMSLKTAAGFVSGETVLVQGATRVAGRLAVKGGPAARRRTDHRDRPRRRPTWRRRTSMPKGDGYDVVLDYLWGRPTEILLRSLVPQTFRSRSRPG